MQPQFHSGTSIQQTGDVFSQEWLVFLHSCPNLALQNSREKAGELSQSAEDPRKAAAHLLNQAWSLYLMAEHQAALDLLPEVDRLLREAPQNETLTWATILKGNILLAINKLNQAMETLLKALELAYRLENPLPLGEALMSIGALYLHSGDTDQALAEFKKAQQIFNNYENLFLLTCVQCHLSGLFLLLMDDELYEIALDTCQKNAEANGWVCIQAQVYVHRAQQLLKKGLAAQAEEWIARSLALAEEHHLRKVIVQAKSLSGQVCLQTNHPDHAVTLFSEALSAAETALDTSASMLIHQYLAQAYDRLEDYQNGYQHFRTYHQLYESVQSEKNDLRFKTIETTYRIQALQSQARIIQQKNDQLEKEISERLWVEEKLKESEQRFRDLANLDPLTNIYNRRYFFELTDMEIKRAQRYEHPLSLMMIDIDHFKRINDQYGHLGGDQTLIWFTQQLKIFLRNTDIIGRFGGEEFVILLPETNLYQAIQVGQRLVRHISRQEFTYQDAQLNLTVSAGIAAYNSDLSLDQWVDHADQALYSAKQCGRNQAGIWAPYDEQARKNLLANALAFAETDMQDLLDI
ncbi:MAG: hypothetical protein CVU39_12255 [Chloroflexi bacterium HGW-Chloroflexi-10]|nr:MAG: hypothetical protein CVU39_12255 [Chloroflexi bacterium HGW-Chloroflexi-10]